jgi:alkanesulfonate monooxygenase SsuD/methylene tetrahydromethanopterin reductase-like flavin-dependent oxidoreductase (luciferase family)
MATLGVTFYPHGLSYTTVATLGKLAEEQGFDGVFVVEGGVNNDVMAMVQAIAMRTQRITVGTNIANLYLRHPATLGAGAVAIDELSGGRLVLGIGVNNPGMLASLGITSRHPRAALRETTEWLRQVFAGHTPPSIRTPFRPAQHPIPVHFAGVALETAELAGEIADGLMCYLASTTRLQQATAHMQRGAQQAGRDPQALTVSLLIPTFLSDDLPAAREAARRFLSFYAALSVYTRMFRRSGFASEMDDLAQALARGEQQQGIAACISDRLLDAVCLVGPLSRCQEHLAAWREAGLSYPLLAPQAVKADQATAVRHFLETFNA